MLGRKQKALQRNRSADFNPDFIFTEKEGTYDGSWAMADVMSQLKKKVRLIVTGISRPWAALRALTLTSLPFAICVCSAVTETPLGVCSIVLMG